MKSLIIGIDEAGRGPILGPMVVACVALSKDAGTYLAEECGIMDSKRFGSGEKAHQRRMRLVPLILESAAHVDWRIVSVEEIDQRVFKGELNQLERDVAGDLLKKAPIAEKIIADGSRLFSPLRKDHPHLQAHDRAESLHAAVAAASIIAKTHRDEAWKRIVQRYHGEFGDVIGSGGGYPNAHTKRFLRAYCTKYKSLPPEGRKSWPWDFVHDLMT